MAHAEYNAVMKALKNENFRVKPAAARLRIGRSTLYRFISIFGIDLKGGESAAATDQDNEASAQFSNGVEDRLATTSVVRTRIVFKDGEYHLVRRIAAEN
jgi:hypothetical protein